MTGQLNRPFIHTQIPQDSLESHINLICMFWDSRWKSENQENSRRHRKSTQTANIIGAVVIAVVSQQENLGFKSPKT